MSELSPSAFAIWDAAWDCPIGDCKSIEAARQRQIAAALRAAAENFLIDWDAIQCCDFLLDMADELEAQ